MCDPITIISVGLGIGQSMMSMSAANAQYKEQVRVQQDNAINASNAAENQFKNLNIRAMQEDAAASQQQQQTNIDAAKATASIQVAATQGGVSGMSVAHVLGDVYSQKGRSDAALDTNIQMNRDYLAGEKKAAEANGQSQINSVPIPEKPSFLPFALDAFSTGLGAFTDYKKRKAS